MGHDLKDAAVRCESARQQLLASMAALAAVEQPLATAIREHADRYLEDETRGRAMRLQAVQIDPELGRCTSAQSALEIRIAERGIECGQRICAEVSDDTKAILDDVASGTSPTLAGSGLPRAVAVEIVALGELAILTQAYDTAAAIIDLHRETLETFVRDHAVVSRKTRVAALKRCLGDEGENNLIEFASHAAKEIGAELAWFLKLADLWRKYRKAIEEQVYRGAGPEDALLDLVLDLKEQNEALEALAETI